MRRARCAGVTRMLRSVTARGVSLRIWMPPDWPRFDATAPAVAIELRQFPSGMAPYALVGATPAAVPSIESIPFDERPFHVPHAGYGVTRFGLPDELRPGVERALALTSLTPVQIVLAAHHEVDSSIVSFYNATKVVASLVAIAEQLPELADAELIEVTRAAIHAHPFGE
jgi:hypothetical protein